MNHYKNSYSEISKINLTSSSDYICVFEEGEDSKMPILFKKCKESNGILSKNNIPTEDGHDLYLFEGLKIVGSLNTISSIIGSMDNISIVKAFELLENSVTQLIN